MTVCCLRCGPVALVLCCLFGGAVNTAFALGEHSERAESTHTEGARPESVDCGDTGIDYAPNRTLTRAERIARMDSALQDSLDRYDTCRNAELSSGERSSQSGGEDSAPSGDISGMAGDALPEDMSGASGTNPTSMAREGTTNTLTLDAGPVHGPGKAVEDFEAGDSDDVLAAQIRTLAETTQDPEERAALWEEYRRYKGLESGP